MVTRVGHLFHLLHCFIEQSVSPGAQGARGLHQVVQGRRRDVSAKLQHGGIELSLSIVSLIFSGDPRFELREFGLHGTPIL